MENKSVALCDHATYPVHYEQDNVHNNNVYYYVHYPEHNVQDR